MRLVERVGSLHKTTTRLLRKRLAAKTDRPFQQLRALIVIDRSPEPCTQAMLADKLIIDASAASRLVDQLVADGLVKRCDAADRRSVRLTVTRAASRDLALIDTALAQIENDLVAVLGKTAARKLADTIGELTDALSAG
jgi:MarR family transcriptional regulator, transcriptional regulator for hemolysin